MALSIIAIIGRPNVGKSTLFNRLIGRRCAITSAAPGTTRDRIYHSTEINGKKAILVDTGGMEFDKKQNIEADVQSQARIAADEADVVYFVLDGSEPLTANDFDCAQYLRKSKKPIIAIVNKADNKKAEDLSQIFKLGLGEPVAVSSIHNTGIDVLEEKTGKELRKIQRAKGGAKERTSPKLSKKEIKLAIVGRPNVGKSSLVNCLVGFNRLIVSEKPGTTIDATDTAFKRGDIDFSLIDTAGLRRRGKVGRGIEYYGVIRALQAVERADVACLVLDFSTGIANQDLHVSQYVLEAGKGLIIAVNKCDLMKDPNSEQKRFWGNLQRRMEFIPWAPVLFVSALNKKNVFKILDVAAGINEERKKKINDDLFDMFAKTTTLAHPPTKSGQKILIYKGEQTNACPPEFTFWTNKPEQIHFSYKRFLENEIRRKFGFQGTAIRLEFKNR